MHFQAAAAPGEASDGDVLVNHILYMNAHIKSCLVKL